MNARKGCFGFKENNCQKQLILKMIEQVGTLELFANFPAQNL